MSKLIRFTEEELQSLSVWQSPGFTPVKTPPPKVAEKKPTPEPSLTVEEIERIQQQAYDEAFAQGKANGFAEGHQQGLQEGIAEGHLQGHAEGLTQGLLEAENQQREQANTFLNLMESLSEPFKNMDEAVEKQLVSLSIAIASQLVRREIKQNPGEIIAVIRAAVAVLPVATQKLSLSLHPSDAELVRSSLALSEAMTSWQIIEDPLMTPGGCKVTTDVSLVDATVEKRLAAVIAMVWGDERETNTERLPIAKGERA